MSPLDALLALPAQERIDIVASDIADRTDRFASTDPHDLAEALGIDTAWKPDDAWSFVRYVHRRPLEAATYHSGGGHADAVWLLEGRVAEERYTELARLAERADGAEGGRPADGALDFSFVSLDERRQLEDMLAERELEGLGEVGLNCLAHRTVVASDGTQLHFEGEVEDDGACIHLRTPYDKRDGRFVDLSGCLLDHW